VIASNIAAGDFRSNAGARLWGDWFWAGGYVTGPVSGAMHSATSGGVLNSSTGSPAPTPPDGVSEQLGGYQRVAVHFGDPKTASIHLGGDVEELFKPAFDYDTGSQSLSLADRPELRIDPTTIVGTGIYGVGNNSILNVKNAYVYSVEAAGNIGSLFIQGEYFWFNVARRNFNQGGISGVPAADQIGPDLRFNGGYIEAGWTLTGETRAYNAAAAAYSGIVPSHPFSWKGGTWGAFEIAGRYSVIDLNDRLGFPDGASGGKQTIVTAGFNWYVNRNIRFMLDYMHGTIDKPAGPVLLNSGSCAVAGSGPTAPLMGLQCNVGAKFDAVAMRTQIAF
jgi:phosphate-selective porin OprO/OprP